ncbi:MAG: hypothetical protein K0Q97_1585 [Bacillota bacterium]|jgi:protein subunit release factor A|nr:hypothetical protein [Bacillota bacterium]
MSTISNNNIYLKNIKKFLNKLKTEVIETKEVEKPMNNIYINLETARKEWEDAKNIFENVSDPDLIDYAIYNVDAAQKKYSYLIKQIKSGNTN